MRVLVIGNGGREHTLIWKIRQSPQVTEVFCAPGNGGIAALATRVPIYPDEVGKLVDFAKENKVDLTIVGPEAPLMLGIVDAMQQAGLKVFGPTKEAFLIEGSKSFAKDLMRRYNIPTANYQVFTDKKQALDYVSALNLPVVVKADGLMAGKGVTVAHTMSQAVTAVESLFVNGEARIVIEQYLTGEEVSLMVFVDGETVLPMVVAQDHKPIYDGDKGPNTGGMGAYSPVPQISAQTIDQAMARIMIPTVRALAQEGRVFKGILYGGLIVTKDGPKVIEFNARFGDPETQVVLPRLRTDLIDIIVATIDGELSSFELSWSDQAAVAVVASSPGYPENYRKGIPIRGWEGLPRDVLCFHAGTEMQNSNLITNGGRVLAITGLGVDLESAREQAYAGIRGIQFAGMHFRSDIAGDRD